MFNLESIIHILEKENDKLTPKSYYFFYSLTCH